MYIVTHIRASLSSSVVDEMGKEEEEVKEGFVLVARKGCFGILAACSSCLPVYLYLRFSNVDFDLRFNLVHPDSGKRNMSSSSLLQGERQGDNASRSSSSSSSSSGSGSSSSVIALGIGGCTITKVLNVLNLGDKALYDMVSPFLDIMGKSRFYLGDVGNGTAMKLVVNMIMGSMMASFFEGLLLSEKVGLDPKILVVSQGVISAPMFSMKGISMVKSKYPTAFPLKHQQKEYLNSKSVSSDEMDRVEILLLIPAWINGVDGCVGFSFPRTFSTKLLVLSVIMPSGILLWIVETLPITYWHCFSLFADWISSTPAAFPKNPLASIGVELNSFIKPYVFNPTDTIANNQLEEIHGNLGKALKFGIPFLELLLHLQMVDLLKPNAKKLTSKDPNERTQLQSIDESEETSEEEENRRRCFDRGRRDGKGKVDSKVELCAEGTAKRVGDRTRECTRGYSRGVEVG
ncbi:hypothetical protein GIB67_022681 [Kingdonia uniflora]|uniref:3-hydroxyisobutyrate dehydrogenase-like NAD-binding domain-containing protein n=1 Tax=Kingdonia uniflora TaxID=39325 RepID=A0A7J7P8C2_9MAGN|nr:hypothetical protein GIB67_022681 [Kingdonia uniflora]